VNLVTIKFLTYYFTLLRTVLALPTVLAFACFASPSLYSLSSTVQIVLGIISGIGIIFFLVNAILGTLLFRDNSPFSKLEFSSSVNSLDELRLGIKVYLGLYGSWAQVGTVVPLVFAGLYLVLLMVAVYFMRSRFGLVHYPFSRIYQLGIIMPFWTLLATIAQVIVSPNESVGLILWLVGLAILPFAWGYLESRKEIELLTTNYKSLTTPNEFLEYNYCCIRLANHRSDPNNLTLIEGILSIHIQNCRKPPELCVCQRVRAGLLGRALEGSKEEEEEETHLWFEFIRHNLLEVSEKFEDAPEIWFLLAYIEQDVLSNKFRSLHSIELGMGGPQSLKFEMLAYHHLRRVE
jgi:hypothetical protein